MKKTPSSVTPVWVSTKELVDGVRHEVERAGLDPKLDRFRAWDRTGVFSVIVGSVWWASHHHGGRK